MTMAARIGAGPRARPEVLPFALASVSRFSHGAGKAMNAPSPTTPRRRRGPRVPDHQQQPGREREADRGNRSTGGSRTERQPRSGRSPQWPGGTRITASGLGATLVSGGQPGAPPSSWVTASAVCTNSCARELISSSVRAALITQGGDHDLSLVVVIERVRR